MVLLFILIVMLIIISLIKARDIMFRCAVEERKRSADEIFRLMEYTEIYNRCNYDKLGFEKLTIESKDGLKLRGYYLPSDKKSNSAIIILHGYGVDHHRSCQYIDFFIGKGFNILLVDQRSHGESEGLYTTYGYYEVQDLDLWVDYIRWKLGSNLIIGIHGHSMGAATALMYSKIGEGKVQFIISEAGYSNAENLLKTKMHKLKIPIFPFYKLTCNKIKSRCRFNVKDISPVDIVKESNIPILFIHGDEDELVPWKMAMDMYNTKRKPKTLYIVRGGMHNTCYSREKIRYEKVVEKFLTENV